MTDFFKMTMDGIKRVAKSDLFCKPTRKGDKPECKKCDWVYESDYGSGITIKGITIPLSKSRTCNICHKKEFPLSLSMTPINFSYTWPTEPTKTENSVNG
jgi:hypothetical protein